MKVNRYSAGRSNVGLLSEAQSKLMSPEQAGAAAAAPYEAVASVAGTASDTLMRYEEVKRKTEDADDLSKLTIAKQEAEVQRRIANKQAAVENWSPEQLQARHDEIIRNFMATTEDLTPRNRDEFAAQMSRQATSWLGLSDLDATILRSEQSSERLNATMELAKVNEDWQTYNALNDVALESQLITEAQHEQNRQSAAGIEAGNQLAQQYAEAVKNGTQDDFMADLGKRDLDDETYKAFTAEKTKIDAFSDKAKEQIKMQRATTYSQFLNYGITKNTSKAEVDSFIQRNGISDAGKQNQLHARLRAVKEEDAINKTPWANPASKEVREAANEMVDRSGTPEETARSAVGVAIAYNRAPKMLDDYYNYSMSNMENPNQIMQAGENYYAQEMSSPSLPMTIRDEYRVRLDAYVLARNSGMDASLATGYIQQRFSGTTADTFEQNQKSFSDPDFGESGQTPEEIVADLLQERLDTDIAEQMGLAIGDRGPFGVMTDVPKMPPEMRADASRVSRDLWAWSLDPNATALSTFNALRAGGWYATDINEGVQSPGTVGTGEIQYMKNPPTRGKDFTRQQMANDLEGRTFQIMGEIDPETLTGTWRNVDVREVSLGNGKLFYDEKRRVNVTRWPMMVAGVPLMAEDGIQYFQYDYDESSQPLTGEAKEIAQETFDERSTQQEVFNVDTGTQ
jgi:hypothetical protein